MSDQAERSGTSAPTLSNYERGRKEPRRTTLARILESTGQSLRLGIVPRGLDRPLTRKDRRSLAMHRSVASKLLAEPDEVRSRHKVFLDKFSIRDRLVTNAEFIEFIDADGYRSHDLWHSEGWDWVNQNKIGSPLYWHRRDGQWMHYTLGGLRNLPFDAPVCHISFYEAAAFAEWKGWRLPTEFEWEAASSMFGWGKRWEWTNSAYLPYPGFRKQNGVVGEYNGKFMVNQMVLRGASVVTSVGHSRHTYRNFFHPHLRWQFTGIRLAK